MGVELITLRLVALPSTFFVVLARDAASRAKIPFFKRSIIIGSFVIPIDNIPRARNCESKLFSVLFHAKPVFLFIFIPKETTMLFAFHTQMCIVYVIFHITKLLRFISLEEHVRNDV